MVNAVLVLDDGSVFKGKALGYYSVVSRSELYKVYGEMCFNTSMSGYQEIISDPSYTSQIIVFTFPHIGNTGYNNVDNESSYYLRDNKKTQSKGVVIREDIADGDSWRAENSLNVWLKDNKITAICGIDTRMLTTKIRNKEVANGVIVVLNDESYTDFDNTIVGIIDDLKSRPNMDGLELASVASYNNLKRYWQNGGWVDKLIDSGNKNLAVIDCGIKENILRLLEKEGFDIVVFSTAVTADMIIGCGFDAVFISNGPGDPRQTFKYLKPTIDAVIENKLPIFGICLGHQLLALALGCNIVKLSQGHRGSNQPVYDNTTGGVEITAQNHGFAVSSESLPDDVTITHKSLFDGIVEGFASKTKPILAIQYHPESSAGPHDSRYLFARFREMVK